MLTPPDKLAILKSMKVLSTIILVSVFFALCLPVPNASPYSGSQKGQSILTLDVCHSSTSSVLNNVEVPFIYESKCELALLGAEREFEIATLPFNPSWLTLQIEQPPKI